MDAAGAPARPWLTVVGDDHSRAVCGYHVFLDAPSAMNTGLALRQAIWPKPDPGWPMCGIPTCCMSTTEATSPATSSPHGLELKMRIVFSAVARPQGRKDRTMRWFDHRTAPRTARSPGRRPAPPHPDVDIGGTVRPHRELHRRHLPPADPSPNWVISQHRRVDP